MFPIGYRLEIVMRTKDELFLLGDIGIMLQYLYMSENHRITFNNGITDLQIRARHVPAVPAEPGR